MAAWLLCRVSPDLLRGRLSAPFSPRSVVAPLHHAAAQRCYGPRSYKLRGSTRKVPGRDRWSGPRRLGNQLHYHHAKWRTSALVPFLELWYRAAYAVHLVMLPTAISARGAFTGTPKLLVYKGKYNLEMDDDLGHPYFRKPPYLCTSFFIQVLFTSRRLHVGPALLAPSSGAAKSMEVNEEEQGLTWSELAI